MTKKLAKMFIFALIAALLLCGTAWSAESGGKVMRIGLNYGSSAVMVGNLENAAGSGYRFGYYDENRVFHSLAQTQERRISVAITQNLYLTSGGLYVRESAGAVGVVGCFHVQLPGTFEDLESAQAAADQVENGFVAWVAGSYYARAGSYPSRALAREAAAALGEEAAVGETSAYGYSVLPTGSTRILFQFDGGQAGETCAFGVQPGLEEDIKAKTTFKDRTYYGGFRFERLNGADQSVVVNMVPLEDYVKGVIPYEMSASWPLEALKAQAVCARTYAAKGTRYASNHFDLCTSTDCQVYRGTGSANANSDRAVEETAGMYIRYNGTPIANAVYFSSDGGATEDAKNVWGNDFPYLKGKADPFEADIASIAGNYNWTKVYTSQSLKERLHTKGYQCADIVDFTTKKSEQGNVIEFTVRDSAGKNWTFSRAKVTEILALNSCRFDLTTTCDQTEGSGYAMAGGGSVGSLDGLYAISGDGTVAPIQEGTYVITGSGTVQALQPATVSTPSGAATYTLKGTGWGHNVGLSQWGAYAMAKRGYTYEDILTFYYTGVTVG